ncbi:NAD(P)/FAD-dependent oxidoreductase [Streptomyces sp. NPDC002514]|uniref:NAD(P)/FAD-dependent oxidoreductase n=1 Tax=Streptomyces sp. NPDC001270 TaxID=3364554 RepID=UPI0036C9C22F
MGRAVVVGAGLAGLLAAAALSPAADEVLLLDRDVLPDGPENRKGVPQGHHAHLLMAGGLAAMEDLLPGAGVRARLLAAGAHEVSLSSGMVALTPDGWFHRYRHDGPSMITCTRALLDWVVREAVLSVSGNVRVHRAAVEGLLGDAGRVHGVRVGASDAGDPLGPELDADIVVEAGGRGSHILRWLEEIGITGVPVRNVDSGLANATRVYRTPAGAESFPLTVIQANPYHGRPGRSAMILPIEDDRWMVSLGGTRGGEPPQSPDDFVRYTLDLPHPLVGWLISGAEPLTDVVVSRSTSNARRFFEKSPSWPERLIVLGDALATFNPAYGQGMSVAALGAQVLAREVRRTGPAGPGLSRRVLRGAAQCAEGAWATAVGTDVLYPAVRGGKPTIADRLTARYSRMLTRSATGSYDAASALWDVTSLRTTPTRLLRPRAVLAAVSGSPLPHLSEPPLSPRELTVLDRLRKSAIA